MHRTTTAATLLVTVAVSALSGCVTIQHPPAPGAPAPSSRPSARHPEVSSDPHLVQAPAHEALERVGPPRRPAPPTSAPRPAVPPSPTAAPRRTPTGPPKAQEPRRPEQRPTQRNVPRVPDLPGPSNQGMCDLGRRYGGWRPDSPEAAICKETYGS